jgi:hypothetical protein
MSADFEDDEDPDIIKKYNPSEYELRIDHLLEAHHSKDVIKITTFSGDIFCAEVLFLNDYETRIEINTAENTTVKTLEISEIRYTEIITLKKRK